jgi:thiol-disulfide isomerase/thioredoxin
MKKVVAALMVVLAVASGLLSFDAAAQSLLKRKAPELEVGDWVNSGALKIDDLKGKVVIFEFYAPWSIPSRDAIVLIRGLYKRYKVMGLEVISITKEKNRDWVTEFARRNNIVNPIAIKSKSEKKFGMTTYPYAVVIDRGGLVVWQGDPLTGLEDFLKRFFGK